MQKNRAYNGINAKQTNMQNEQRHNAIKMALPVMLTTAADIDKQTSMFHVVMAKTTSQQAIHGANVNIPPSSAI